MKTLYVHSNEICASTPIKGDCRKSRGDIVVDYLTTIAEDKHRIIERLVIDDYDGFNAVFGNLLAGEWVYFTNQDSSLKQHLPNDVVHAIGNLVLDKNREMSKTKRIRTQLNDFITSYNQNMHVNEFIDSLFNILT